MTKTHTLWLMYIYSCVLQNIKACCADALRFLLSILNVLVDLLSCLNKDVFNIISPGTNIMCKCDVDSSNRVKMDVLSLLTFSH